ncbi:decapping and exoribonuclease protein-like [Amphiura filiformis]|uniref:decapping and exoribonuclease protein-like n=1 Tax=Amphiura filiformis TaxID=82378 RepID=UPI003B223E87
MKRKAAMSEDGVAKQSKAEDSGQSASNIASMIPTSSQETQQCTTFSIHPLTKYNGDKFPFFKQPREVGYYSLDKDRKLHQDSRLRKFFFPPQRDEEIAFNLGYGYEKFIRRDDDVKERLDNILTWLVKNKQKFQDPQNQRLLADFIAWRGHFTKLLCTPYEKREGWAMAVTLFNGTWYISEVETQENRHRRKNMNSRELEMTYWGYKFEQYVTSVDGNTPPDTSQAVDNHEAYCSVVKTTLNNHRLLFSGEVDCSLYGCDKGPPANYIELKTSREWYTPNHEKNFYRFKLLKWWAQSFLIGIPQVICGFRDDEGVVSHLKSFDTLRMPKYSRGEWNGAVCFHFMEQFLTYIKSVVVEDDPSVVFLFERRPGSSEITYRKLKGPPDQFLPDWYIQEFPNVSNTPAGDPS